MQHGATQQTGFSQHIGLWATGVSWVADGFPSNVDTSRALPWGIVIASTKKQPLYDHLDGKHIRVACSIKPLVCTTSAIIM